MNSGSVTTGEDRIGLALSGGGFRASLFHLGVIRRLEELGIMEKVSIVSAVSGGSIVAAFYLCEMEKQLRESRVNDGPADRVALFEKIAEKFLKGVEHNLRTRALIFTPRFHPLLFIKTTALKAFRRGARAELIQAEYDKFFFFNDTMDQLPVERPEKAIDLADRSCMGSSEPFYGPRLLLNTTSLLTGERISFSRDASSGINDLKTSDRNVIPLSRVVGASSGVPVLFPPTSILGDLLVDGGISDNQGIEGLLDPESHCNVILVSDASGQLQVKHTLSPSDTSVYGRMNEILQFQIRNKLLAQLLAWGSAQQNRHFAFVHLLINLKSREGRPARVSTSILPALGRIRTDLDQFSPVECEALMYHGYTLIDSQLRQYCCDFLRKNSPHFNKKLKTPPLFSLNTLNNILAKMQKHKKYRDPIREDLEAGSENLYLLRCLKKHLWPTLSVLIFGLVALIMLVWRFSAPLRLAVEFVKYILVSILYGIVPRSSVTTLDRFFTFLGYSNIQFATAIDSVAHLLALIVVAALAVYVASYPVYEVVRYMAMKLDRRNYRRITGEKDFTVHWTQAEETVASKG